MTQPETVRSVAQRLEHYFDWYVRVDPDVPAAVWMLLSRFFALAEAPQNVAAARELLREMSAFSLGSPWEEARLALSRLALQRA